MALGATQQTPLADRHLMTQSELQTRLCVLMAGYASERLVLGDISNGAENDLKEATRLASQMVAHYGMSQQLGPVYYDVEAEHPFLGQRLAMESFTSDRTSEMIEREARGLLTAAVDGAAQLLKEHRTVLDRLIVLLLEKETVERDDLELLARSPAESSPAKAAETALARSDQVH
jgi:cell division protease FtsH